MGSVLTLAVDAAVDSPCEGEGVGVPLDGLGVVVVGVSEDGVGVGVPFAGDDEGVGLGDPVKGVVVTVKIEGEGVGVGVGEPLVSSVVEGVTLTAGEDKGEVWPTEDPVARAAVLVVELVVLAAAESA